ncbi:MAG: MBL fold metallo-hydrolase [Candidatus Bathyarchaeia archaeon]
MHITFIGSGGSKVTRRRCCPSILIDGDTLIDCGPGSLKNLRSVGVDLSSIDRILVSHIHADHLADMVPILWAMQLDGRNRSLTLIGPKGLGSIVDRLLELLGTPTGFIGYPTSYIELDGGEEIGDISTCRVEHSIHTIAYRLDRNGRSVCYSGDTRPCRSLVDLAYRVDILIHEASLPSSYIDIAIRTGHSTGREAGMIAYESSARKLILFHISLEEFESTIIDEARSIFKGDTTIAEDFLSIEI